MPPALLPLRAPPRAVCWRCDALLRPSASSRRFLAVSYLQPPARPTPPRLTARSPPTRRTTITAPAPETAPSDLQTSERIATVRASLAGIEIRIRDIFASSRVQTEAVILATLQDLHHVARLSMAIRLRQPLPATAHICQSSAGAILAGLGGDSSAKPNTRDASPPLRLDALPAPGYLSKLARDIITNEKVFLSASILGVYICLQRLLACPKAIPEALYLYAHKPIPVEGSCPPRFTKPSPKSAKLAVPADLAADALGAAIDAKDLTLALAIVDHTYRTPAWQRHRLITKMGLPAAIASITPLAIYMVAQEMSVYSGFIDPFLFKLYAILGMSTYVLCTGTLGFVAWTSHNDHHDRVVWRPGIPLIDRFIKEDERAALDRIACAWGFKEEWRRGDEEGDDWEGLRQWILLRGMILDKPDLMPGMNTSR